MYVSWSPELRCHHQSYMRALSLVNKSDTRLEYFKKYLVTVVNKSGTRLEYFKKYLVTDLTW